MLLSMNLHGVDVALNECAWFGCCSQRICMLLLSKRAKVVCELLLLSVKCAGAPARLVVSKKTQLLATASYPGVGRPSASQLLHELGT